MILRLGMRDLARKARSQKHTDWGDGCRRGSGLIDQENARQGHEIERRWMRQAMMGILDGNEDGVIDEED